MKNMILFILIFVLFAGCTQNEEVVEKVDKNESLNLNITEIKNETTNNTEHENNTYEEYTEKMEDIESDAVECYYEDKNEKILTKIYNEQMRMHYVTQYENTEMIFDGNDGIWYLKTQNNEQFKTLGLDDDCVWIKWDMKKINKALNQEEETVNSMPSLFDLQSPNENEMYCKEGKFGIEIFTPSEKICDMTELIISMYTYNQ